jgi:hypothetical protein
MSEDIERHVVRKFEICQRLGKGVKSALLFFYFPPIIIKLIFILNSIWKYTSYITICSLTLVYLKNRPMELYGKLSKNARVRLSP